MMLTYDKENQGNSAGYAHACLLFAAIGAAQHQPHCLTECVAVQSLLGMLSWQSQLAARLLSNCNLPQWQCLRLPYLQSQTAVSRIQHYNTCHVTVPALTQYAIMRRIFP